MTTPVFCSQYADQYDLLYRDKDYQAECDLIEGVFRRYAKGSIETILDLGCGTGNHAIPLAERGYHVVGVDRSADMLSHAREKAKSAFSGYGPALSPLRSAPAEQGRRDESMRAPDIPIFVEGDVRTIDVGQRFDAVLMMFAVLGYQLTNEDVSAALQTVRKHLKAGGIFVCDVWYGPAVLTIRPSERVKVIPTSDGKLIRAASGTLDTYRHLCEVRYHLWRLSGSRVVSETEESHQMRYFFPQELALFFSQAGLTVVDIRSFDDLGSSPNETTWNVIVIGKSL